MADEPPIGPGQEGGNPVDTQVPSSFADQARAMRRMRQGDGGIGMLLMTLLKLLLNPDEEEIQNDAQTIPADPQEVPLHNPSLRRLAIRSHEVPPAGSLGYPGNQDPRRSLRVSG